MDFLYVCNLGSDTITVIDKEYEEIVDQINLDEEDGSRVGPHSLCCYKDKIYTANSYSKGITIVHFKEQKIKHIQLGVSCTDLAVFEDKIYVLCGDSNNIVVLSNEKETIEKIIPCGNLPHSIYIDKLGRRIITSNLYGESINVISVDDHTKSELIKVGAFPTSATYTLDNEFILVCESNIGLEFNGALCMISDHNNKIVNRIALGKAPMNMHYDGEECFVSNFADGMVTVVDVINWTVKEKYNVGGMPRGIVGDEKRIFICDSYNNCVLVVDRVTGSKKTIFTGKEPMKIARYISL